MDALLGPDGQPARFDGAAWVTSDGRYWWNGTAWLPVVRRRSFRPNWFVIGMAVLCVGAVIYIVRGFGEEVARRSAVIGVTNTRIDSPTQVEFDYQRANSCQNLTFEYWFYDQGGSKIQVLRDLTSTSVIGHRVYHITVTMNTPINSSAARFLAVDTCHS